MYKDRMKWSVNLGKCLQYCGVKYGTIYLSLAECLKGYVYVKHTELSRKASFVNCLKALKLA